MSTEEEFHLLESVDTDSPCPKCGLKGYQDCSIEEQNGNLFLHCRCIGCFHEWVE